MSHKNEETEKFDIIEKLIVVERLIS